MKSLGGCDMMGRRPDPEAMTITPRAHIDGKDHLGSSSQALASARVRAFSGTCSRKLAR
jgi:hypothetical protein